MVKNLPANVGDLRDAGSIPGEEMATHSSILAWEIPWTRGIWQAAIHGVPKSWTQLSNRLHMHTRLDESTVCPFYYSVVFHCMGISLCLSSHLLKDIYKDDL